MRKLISLSMLALLTSCGLDPHPPTSSSTPIKGEYIYRYDKDCLFQIDPMLPQKRPDYPWDKGRTRPFPKITKDFFRCNGSLLNPVRIVQKDKDKEATRYYDCGGPQKHSLPLRDQKEFIYPILIDLLNYLQESTNKRVVITSGHCCPEHNAYLDSSTYNQSSKHLIGAEVDFYMQGMEEEPLKVIDLLLAYYTQQPKYQGKKEYQFIRYEQLEKINVTTPPWYNKEVFIKLYKKNEGRDFDNRHPHPYISIQARYDYDLQERVNYSWDKAYHNFHRY